MLSPVVAKDTGVGSCFGMQGPTWLPASLQGSWLLGAPQSSAPGSPVTWAAACASLLDLPGEAGSAGDTEGEAE